MLRISASVMPASTDCLISARMISAIGALESLTGWPEHCGQASVPASAETRSASLWGPRSSVAPNASAATATTAISVQETRRIVELNMG
jgi:hypothetical protein